MGINNKGFKMESSNTKNDLMAISKGVTKSLLSRIPGLKEGLAGWEAYKRNVFERNTDRFIEQLRGKIQDLEAFIGHEWVRTEEGQQFIRKVLDAALDEQLQDKQEFFINAMINGVNDDTIIQIEKLKFIDILRHLSRSALLILAEIHILFKNQVRGPGRKPDPIQEWPLVDAGIIAEKLSENYDPYLVTSAISEMESQGLFSRTGEWVQDPHTKRYRPGAGFSTSLCYTDFTARFVDFISVPNNVLPISLPK
jgi:hypothetical protein